MIVERRQRALFLAQPVAPAPSFRSLHTSYSTSSSSVHRQSRQTPLARCSRRKHPTILTSASSSLQYSTIRRAEPASPFRPSDSAPQSFTHSEQNVRFTLQVDKQCQCHVFHVAIAERYDDESSIRIDECCRSWLTDSTRGMYTVKCFYSILLHPFFRIKSDYCKKTSNRNANFAIEYYCVHICDFVYHIFRSNENVPIYRCN
jgi:hypothetical protein